jgi:sucrose phosphorylase
MGGLKTGARLVDHLTALYGEDDGRATMVRLEALLATHREHLPHHSPVSLNEKDAILITYADQVRTVGEPPLRTLAAFCRAHLRDRISIIHILPFFPYSSDDGFSVVDFRTVNPAWGDWQDVSDLGRSFQLMFDAVLNHVSAQGPWFLAFLRGDPAYRDFFMTPEPGADLAKVVRPRTSPLLTTFRGARGDVGVWTTFSADQVDLNYRNPDVLLEMIDILLSYVRYGASLLRLDAIAYLWKEPGTSCIHLPQTHRIIRLLRAVLDEVAPHVFLITETNVPHEENVSYFGDGIHEAQLVYNFALPPLVLDAFHRGATDRLSAWAATLRVPSRRTAFFNFLASHDGIGLNPARGWIPDEDIDRLVGRIRACGGRVSEKRNPDGSVSPYELNINYLDALAEPLSQEAPDLQIDRFLAAQAIMLALAGVPGIYFHSLVGSRGWPEGVDTMGYNRAINRQKLERSDLEAELADPTSRRAQVFRRYSALLRARASTTAFHPAGDQEVVHCGERIFALRRTSPDGKACVLCLHNVTKEPQFVEPGIVRALGVPARILCDRISGRKLSLDEGALLDAFQTLWLSPDLPRSCGGGRMVRRSRREGQAHP